MNGYEYKKMYLFEDFYWWYKGLHKILSNQLKRYCQGRIPLNILDAGCGTGKVLGLLKTYGKVIGLDISPNAIDFARTRDIKAKLFQGRVEALPFNNNVFDCVVVLDVLYMLENDAEAITEFSRVLKRQGILIANLPAYQWLYSSHDVGSSAKRRYSKGRIARIFSEHSFRIEKITYWNTILFPIEIVIRIINKFLPRKFYETDLKYLPRLVNSLFTAIIYLEAMLINIFSLPCGLSLFVIARKG